MVLDWEALEAARWKVEAEIAAAGEGQAVTTGGCVSQNASSGSGIGSRSSSPNPPSRHPISAADAKALAKSLFPFT